MGLFDWEEHVSVFAPDYDAVLKSELHEVLRLDVAVVLWGVDRFFAEVTA